MQITEAQIKVQILKELARLGLGLQQYERLLVGIGQTPRSLAIAELMGH